MILLQTGHTLSCVGVLSVCVPRIKLRRQLSKLTNKYLTRYKFIVMVAANMTLTIVFDFLDFKIKRASFCFKTHTHTLSSPGSIRDKKFFIYLNRFVDNTVIQPCIQNYITNKARKKPRDGNIISCLYLKAVP